MRRWLSGPRRSDGVGGRVLLGGSDGAEGKVCKKGSVFSAPISDKYDDAITFINDRTRHAGFLNFFKLVYIYRRPSSKQSIYIGTLYRYFWPC